MLSFKNIFGFTSYLYFFWTLPLATTSFLVNGSVNCSSLQSFLPYNIDYNNLDSDSSVFTKFLLNSFLLTAFFVPHTFFARSLVKKKLQTLGLPKDLERTFFVFQASVLLHVLLANWQSIQGTVWNHTETELVMKLLDGGFWLGFVWLLTSTFAIDHFELFGLRQSLGMGNMLQHTNEKLVTSFHYKYVRHPIMLGLLVIFWSTSVMSLGHFFFSLVLTTYIGVAVELFEEPELEKKYGDDYKKYKSNTPAICPLF